MKDISRINNPYNDDKLIGCCSIFGMMSVEGRTFSGSDIMTAIASMHDRGNGLGGGFAVYGLYPEYADHYAMHIMFMHSAARRQVEDFLRDGFVIAKSERVPTRPVETVTDPPDIWRYFVNVKPSKSEATGEDDYIVRQVMEINTVMDGAYVFSSGKNLGVFKGVGFPEDIGRFFCLEDYEGYLWTAHGRFPTNSQAWWGGAHPFSILDWTVVHNGEISSYGINRRYLEMFGYTCTMHTDTEVIAYAVDLLMRRHSLPAELLARVFSPPMWNMLQYMDPDDGELCKTLRQVYGSLLMNGPFTVVIAHRNEMVGLTDRVRLRPLVAGVKDDMLYLSSEESAIRLICPDLRECWSPIGGEPVIGRLGEPLAPSGRLAAA
ncbi:MAG TPA: glutamine amidotransferase family protein [Armatimonadota bacterium]|nr:glutamine amidotransferase family protein [Armatimonadota bacterium]